MIQTHSPETNHHVAIVKLFQTSLSFISKTPNGTLISLRYLQIKTNSKFDVFKCICEEDELTSFLASRHFNFRANFYSRIKNFKNTDIAVSLSIIRSSVYVRIDEVLKQ